MHTEFDVLLWPEKPSYTHLREGVHLQLDERRIGHSTQPLS